MSYILDALKRAERERKQGQVSVLDEIPTAPVTGEPERGSSSSCPVADNCSLAVTRSSNPELASCAQSPVCKQNVIARMRFI